jgi:hypothetical protein
MKKTACQIQGDEKKQGVSDKNEHENSEDHTH